MTFSLMGLDPAAVATYHWIGDDAVDLAASNVREWLDHGTGLAICEGSTPVSICWRALRDTVNQHVWRLATVGLALPPPSPEPPSLEAMIEAQMPFVRREAFAFGVTSIAGHPEIRFKQVALPGGMRVADEVIAQLEGVSAEVETGNGSFRVRLVQHLGRLILEASHATEQEKKV